MIDEFQQFSHDENPEDNKDHCLLLEINGRGTLSITMSSLQYKQFCLAKDTLKLAHGGVITSEDVFAVLITMIAFNNILGASQSRKNVNEKLEEMKGFGMVDKSKRLFDSQEDISNDTNPAD